MNTNRYSKLILQISTFTGTTYYCSAQTSDTTFVNFNETYQAIDGFGAAATNGLGAFKPITNAQADMFFSASKGIGLSLLRSQITPKGTSRVLSLMRQAQARGAKVWSCPWSPPAAWKSNDDSVGSGFLLPEYYPAYANQFVNYVAAMKDSGINLYGVSIQNEPDAANPWESCVWSDSEMHAFIPYLYDSLQSRGLGTTKIMASEESDWSLSIASEILGDPATDTMLGICDAHDYGFADPPTNFNTNGKPLWETEVCTLDAFDSSISNALMWANNINQYMTVTNANAWHYWWLIGGSTNNDNEGLTDTAGNPAKRMYVLGNYSKFVRPGYMRVDDTLGPAGVVFSAYKYSLGDFVVVAVNNNSTATPIVFSLNGLSASYVTPWITSGTLDLIEQQNVSVSNSSFSYTLPDSSVTTFVYTGTTTAVKPVYAISNNISVYPNPAQNEIAIAGLDAALKNQIVRIYSSIGQLIYENEISGTKHYTLNLAGYAPGMYCIVISNAQGQVVKKVMIAK